LEKGLDKLRDILIAAQLDVQLPGEADQATQELQAAADL